MAAGGVGGVGWELRTGCSGKGMRGWWCGVGDAENDQSWGGCVFMGRREGGVLVSLRKIPCLRRACLLGWVYPGFRWDSTLCGCAGCGFLLVCTTAGKIGLNLAHHIFPEEEQVTAGMALILSVSYSRLGGLFLARRCYEGLLLTLMGNLVT